jgi:cyclase
MLKKRIIPCLDVKDGRTVKGVHFVNIRDAGDPVELARKYVEDGADELVFLDITASLEKRKTLIRLVSEVARNINIPFTVGGGINGLDDVQAVIGAGADKVSINTSAVMRPELMTEIAREFGSQCVVVAIDARFQDGEWQVYTHGGKTSADINALSWAKEAQERGAGEILLTSMNNDGTKSGFALDITDAISKSVSIPVIASGGAGTMEHFYEVFAQTSASAALAASIFHFNEIPIPALKQYLKNKKIAIR